MKYSYLAVFCLSLLSSAAQAQSVSGPRLVGRIGYETPTVSSEGDVYKLGSAVSFGVEGGFDLSLGRVTFGPYATYESSGVSICAGSECLNVKDNIAVGGRLGLPVGRGVAYAKLGYAELKLEAASGTLSATQTETGIQGAIGYEHNFGRSLFWMVEIDYSDFGNINGVSDVFMQRRHVATGIGVRF
jgi:outer membrane immunogenic protein